jgi:hypothetical protein
MHLRIVSITVLSFVASCATTDQTVANAPAQKICEREYRVGSNIPTRDCRAAITDEERQRANDELRNAIKPSAAKPPGT